MWIWFLFIGVIILTPETLHYILISRPRRKKLERTWEKNRLFWSIRNMEMELYGKWLS